MSMEFLYFPEDKLEYIPSLLMLFVFVLGAIFTMYIFYKKSKKEDEKPNKEYPKHIEAEPEPKSEPKSETDSDNKK